MQLKQRQYKAIDVLKIGYDVSKPLILCLLFFTIVEAIVSTFVVALTTANFIERAELIFFRESRDDKYLSVNDYFVGDIRCYDVFGEPRGTYPFKHTK